MYYGSAKDAIDWFDRLGYTLPYGINAADFILDLASSDVATEKRCVAAAGQAIPDVSLTGSCTASLCICLLAKNVSSTMAANMPLRFASSTVKSGEGLIWVGGEKCGDCIAADH